MQGNLPRSPHGRIGCSGRQGCWRGHRDVPAQRLLDGPADTQSAAGGRCSGRPVEVGGRGHRPRPSRRDGLLALGAIRGPCQEASADQQQPWPRQRLDQPRSCLRYSVWQSTASPGQESQARLSRPTPTTPPEPDAPGASGRQAMRLAERVRVREIDDDEGWRILRMIRRGTGSVVTWRRAQMVLLSAQRMTAAKPCRPGSITTITTAPTPQPAANHPSPGWPTSLGSTTRARLRI